VIYVANILDEKFIKVGFAEDVTKRIAALQTGNPFKINLTFAVEGTLRQEQSIHAALTTAFGRVRIPCPPNEWYPGRHPITRQFMESLRFGALQGLAFAESYNPAVRQPGKKKGGHYEPVLRWSRDDAKFGTPLGWNAPAKRVGGVDFGRSVSRVGPAVPFNSPRMSLTK
jgi:hypothetical protein